MAGRYKAYPAYKDSGVEWLGEIPEGWALKKASWCFIAQKGKDGQSLTKEYIAQNLGCFPVYSGQTSNDGIMGYIDTFEFDFNEEGVLFSTTVGAKAMTLKYIKGKFSLSQNCLIFKVKDSRLLNSFYYYALQPLFLYERNLIPEHMQASFRAEDFYHYKLIFPTVKEQQTIAQFLDYETAKIDALIAKQEQLIELLKEKRQAVISHAVTKGLNPDAPMKDSGVEWLGQVPEHWEVVAVRNVSEFVSTGGTPKREESFVETEEVNWFTPGDFLNHFILTDSEKFISRDSVIKGDAKIYPANSVVVIGIGATLGKVALINKEFSCNQQINVVVPNKKIESHFLAYSLLAQKEQMQLSSNSSTIGIMNQDKTKSLKILAPPISEQLKIINFIGNKLEKFDSLESKILGLNILLQERKTALISAAVTGKIDVRDWQPPSVG